MKDFWNLKNINVKELLDIQVNEKENGDQNICTWE